MSRETSRQHRSISEVSREYSATGRVDEARFRSPPALLKAAPIHAVRRGWPLVHGTVPGRASSLVEKNVQDQSAATRSAPDAAGTMAIRAFWVAERYSSDARTWRMNQAPPMQAAAPATARGATRS